MPLTEEWLTQPGGLAERLRELRRAAGLTGDQLAERAGWQARSKVPKIEGGKQTPSPADIRAWAQASGRPEAADDLLELLAAGEAEHQEFEHQRHRGQAAIQREFDKAVRKGKRIRNVEVTFVPGLLQTADYARSRFAEAVRVHDFAEKGVEPGVAARMKRQDVLYESGRTFEFILTEAALRLLGCPRDVMLGQIDRLATLSGLGSITVGIIPFDIELAVAPVDGFLIVDDVTYLETHGRLGKAQGRQSAVYDRIADALLAEAMTGEGALSVLSRAAAALREVAT